jgi:peptide deformylase
VALFSLNRSMDGRLREIVRLGHPVLRQVAEPAGKERFGTRFLRDLSRDLLRTMFDSKGMGLAAPQIAVSVRVFAYYVPGDGDEDEVSPRVVVNPVLTFSGEPTARGWEGCLSIPDLRGLVSRYESLVMTGFDVDGTPVKVEAQGLHARVIQHEYDHLDGIVFLDRMADMKQLMFEDEWDHYAQEKELPVDD